MTLRLHTASFHHAMRSTGYTSPLKQDALLRLVHFNLRVFGVLFLRRSIGSPDRGHPRFRNFYTTIPVDVVVKVKSCVNRLLALRVHQ